MISMIWKGLYVHIHAHVHPLYEYGFLFLLLCSTCMGAATSDVGAGSGDITMQLNNFLKSNLSGTRALFDLGFDRREDELVFIVDTEQYPFMLKAITTAQLGRKQIAVLQQDQNEDPVTLILAYANLTLYRSWPNETAPLTVYLFANHTQLLVTNMEAFLSARNTWILGSRSYLSDKGSEHGPNMQATASAPNLSSNVYYIEQDDLEDGLLALYEIFGIKNGNWIYTSRVTSESVWGLRLHHSASSPVGRRRNFHGLTLNVAHVLKAPIFTTVGAETIRGGPWGADLISYQILGYMQDYLNFTIQFHNASTWVYAPGTPATGTLYGGMALMVRNGEADLALSNTGMWPTKDFGFLYISRLYKEIFVYYHTTTQASSGDLFMEVFPMNVTLCLAALFVGVILAAVLFFNVRDPRELLSWAVSMFSQQGPPEPEYRSGFQRSGRLFLLALLIFCILFYACVSALLLAKLSFNEGINDVNALIKRGYKFGIWSDSILDNGFKLNQMKPSSPIYPVGKYYKSFPTEPDGAAEVVRSKKFGFVSHQNWFLSYLPALLKMDICRNMKQLTIPDEKRWGSAFVDPKSEFRDHFNLARLHMAQVGLKAYHLRELARTIEDGKPSCYSSSLSLSVSQVKSQSTLGGIYFQEVSLAFYSLGAGFVLCLAVLVLEIIHLGVSKMETGAAATEFQSVQYSTTAEVANTKKS